MRNVAIHLGARHQEVNDVRLRLRSGSEHIDPVLGEAAVPRNDTQPVDQCLGDHRAIERVCVMHVEVPAVGDRPVHVLRVRFTGV